MAFKDPDRRKQYHRDYQKEWRIKYPDKELQYRKKQDSNPIRIAKKKINLINWRKRNTVKHRFDSRLWAKKNKQYVYFMNLQRRIIERGAEGQHTYKEWQELKEQYNFTCPACKRSEPEIKLTEDHIKPLIMGGTNYISNIQPLCGICNCKKHTKEIKYEQ